MASYEQTTIVGNIGKEPTLQTTPQGTQVCNFSVAVTRKWNDKSGQRQEKTNWYSVSVFGESAKIAHQFVRKGEKILLVGTVSVQAYTDKQSGEARASLVLTANFFQLLGGRSDNDETTPHDNGNDIPF